MPILYENYQKLRSSLVWIKTNEISHKVPLKLQHKITNSFNSPPLISYLLLISSTFSTFFFSSAQNRNFSFPSSSFFHKTESKLEVNWHWLNMQFIFNVLQPHHRHSGCGCKFISHLFALILLFVLKLKQMMREKREWMWLWVLEMWDVQMSCSIEKIWVKCEIHVSYSIMDVVGGNMKSEVRIGKNFVRRLNEISGENL